MLRIRAIEDNEWVDEVIPVGYQTAQTLAKAIWIMVCVLEHEWRKLVTLDGNGRILAKREAEPGGFGTWIWNRERECWQRVEYRSITRYTVMDK